MIYSFLLGRGFSPPLILAGFTLAADTNSGNRPSFTPAATPEKGAELFNYFVSHAKSSYPYIQTGEFCEAFKQEWIHREISLNGRDCLRNDLFIPVRAWF
jgi:hypothetical protein